ncbi:hypothetical protein PVK06_009903 [Gossypium arboreum]|uniref:Uncharacterized protein n=1 Tax=Gossypium arboreum TaxID=29729 RepID=A0ABR0QP64_GOSAR|nr:hypothetical protein PVK06_009903 [Gossypium arboreum]
MEAKSSFMSTEFSLIHDSLNVCPWCNRELERADHILEENIQLVGHRLAKIIGSCKSLWLTSIAASCWSIWLARKEIVMCPAVWV